MYLSLGHCPVLASRLSPKLFQLLLKTLGTSPPSKSCDHSRPSEPHSVSWAVTDSEAEAAASVTQPVPTTEINGRVSDWHPWVSTSKLRASTRSLLWVGICSGYTPLDERCCSHCQFGVQWIKERRDRMPIQTRPSLYGLFVPSAIKEITTTGSPATLSGLRKLLELLHWSLKNKMQHYLAFIFKGKGAPQTKVCTMHLNAQQQ